MVAKEPNSVNANRRANNGSKVAHSTDTSLDFQVGPCLVQPALNQVGDNRVDRKAMELLLALKHAAPNPVSTAQLLTLVWSGRVVVDNVVHRAVATLRKALADPKHIETIRGRGYRLRQLADAATTTSSQQTTLQVVPYLDLRKYPAAAAYADTVANDMAVELAKMNALIVIPPSAANDNNAGLNPDYRLQCDVRASDQASSIVW